MNKDAYFMNEDNYFTNEDVCFINAGGYFINMGVYLLIGVCYFKYSKAGFLIKVLPLSFIVS